MSMDKLLESKRKIRKVNIKRTNEGNCLKLPSQQESLSFEEKYKRMTTYVEKPLFEKIERLSKCKTIRTKTEFVNAAFIEYINKYYE